MSTLLYLFIRVEELRFNPEGSIVTHISVFVPKIFLFGLFNNSWFPPLFTLITTSYLSIIFPNFLFSSSLEAPTIKILSFLSIFKF